ISKAIMRCSATIQSALECYNKLAPQQSPQHPILQYSGVTSYVSLGEFELLKHLRHDILAKPWSNLTYRAIAVKGFKVSCAEEKILHLNVEVHCLQAWVDFKYAELKRVADLMAAGDLPLSSELHAIYQQRICMNDVHQGCLMFIYALGGYQGNVYTVIPDLWLGEDDFGDDMDELLHGEQSAHLEQCI
ncbi:hypothetical protein PAXRUDRAFT_181954, partial [Paxillus rubicundulus Ve08.2h10]